MQNIYTVMWSLCCSYMAVITSRQILSLSPGNEKMQDIAKAIQEGA